MYLPLLCIISKGWFGNIVLLSDYALNWVFYAPFIQMEDLAFSLDSQYFSEAKKDIFIIIFK